MSTAAANDPAGTTGKALRLGWSMAELRGRYREKLAGDTYAPAAGIERTGNPLPLQNERNPKELAIEVEKAVISLATQLSLKVDAAKLRQQTTSTQKALGKDAWDQEWSGLAEYLYHIDADFQDDLYSGTLSSSAAYQLGRALAEVSWALAPINPDPPNHIEFLLGAERVTTMKMLLRRIPNYVDEVTASAIAFSLDRWALAAQNKEHNGEDATVTKLREQVGVWHDLLLDGVPWTTLIKPAAMINRRPSLRPLRPFLLELTVGALGLAGLVVALGVLSLQNQGPAAAIIAALSTVGITAATVRARVKDQAQNLIGQMRRAFDMELAAEAVCRVPDWLPAAPRPNS